MHIQAKVYYVGVNDRVKHRFEGLWSLPQGVSYNSYLIADDIVLYFLVIDLIIKYIVILSS